MFDVNKVMIGDYLAKSNYLKGWKPKKREKVLMYTPTRDFTNTCTTQIGFHVIGTIPHLTRVSICSRILAVMPQVSYNVVTIT